MLLIAIGPPGPLAVFLQVLCWIILPALALVSFFTILHHYARKRKNAANALEGDEIAHLAQQGSKGKGAYLLFDHTGLVREYKRKLSYSHARYAALKKDFDKLEKQYRQGHADRPVHLKIKDMETTQEQLHVAEGQVPSKVLYLKDLVEEKKLEVAFLQSQLESRVRKQHEAEGEKEKMKIEWEAALAEKEQLISYAENQLGELKQQNELLNAAVADGNDRVLSLSNQLEEEQARVITMDQKLQANRQLLQRLYKEFTTCLEQEEASPVIPMQPAYLNSVTVEL
jgi:chromosome segregation ATPase